MQLLNPSILPFPSHHQIRPHINRKRQTGRAYGGIYAQLKQPFKFFITFFLILKTARKIKGKENNHNSLLAAKLVGILNIKSVTKYSAEFPLLIGRISE